MRYFTVVVLALYVSISSSAFAADQLIGVGSVTLNHGDYAQSDNPACPDGRQNDPAGTAIFSIVASQITGLPVGVVLPISAFVKDLAASQGGDLGRIVNGPSGRHASCGTIAIRLPAATRNVSVQLFASEAGRPFLPCTQLDNGFHKCGIRWAAWYYVQKGDVLIATAKNWSGDRNGRTFRIEVHGDVWQQTHVVTAGESLWTIAKSLYGNSAVWQQIYKANLGKIGEDPDSIFAGLVLTLPLPQGW